MKKTILLILVVLTVIFTFSACIFKPDDPEEIESGGSENLYYRLSDNGEGYIVAGIGDCTDKDIVIPDKHNDKPVIGVGDYAFFSNKDISSITLSDSIRSIGDCAFHLCRNIKSISLGKSVEKIGDYAIDGDAYFKISLSPKNKHYKLIDGHLCSIDGKELICYTFKEGETSIVVPNSVEKVDSDSFPILSYNPTISSTLTFNEYMNAKYFGSEKNPYLIFYRADYNVNVELHKDTRIVFSLSNTYLFIPEYITYICPNTYPGVKFEVDPNNKYYKSIDGSLYTKDGKTLVSAYLNEAIFEIADGVEHIDDFAFYFKWNAESVIMPDSVKSIGMFAFNGCTSLKSINLSKSLETIEYGAFQQCHSLEGIEIPKSVKMIAPGAFENCSSITDIEIPDGIEIIYNSFSGCSSLTNVYIPDSVKIIGGGGGLSVYSFATFGSCTSLKNINIPKSVTKIGAYAFFGCSSLEEIIIPDSVTYLGTDAFANCTSLKNVVIGNSVENMDISFSKCTSLESIVIGDSVKEIKAFAFLDLSSLKSVTLGNSVESIGVWAFSGCTSLESINIPNGVTSIGEEAFANCSSLSSIIIPESVTSIGEYAFYGCNMITIYCEVASQPDAWSTNWNPESYKVEWGYKK